MGQILTGPAGVPVPAASTTSIVAENLLPIGQISSLQAVTTGANNGLNTSTVGITNFRVKVNSTPIWDATPEQHRVFLESNTPNNFSPSTELRWPVPLNLDGRGNENYEIGIPAGGKTAFEVIFDANGSTGTLVLGHETTPAKIRFLPRYVQRGTGINSAVTSAIIPLNADGQIVTGVWLNINTNQVSAARLVLDGVEVFNFSTTGQMLAYATRYSPCSITTSVFLRVPKDYYGLKAVTGRSFLDATCGSSGVDEVVFHTLQEIA